MASFNKVILVGNLTRDPELRYTPKGTAVVRIGVALNRTYRTETGELREETTFVDVDAFGRQAEIIAQYFRKGRPILVEGRLRLDQWEDKVTHQKRSQLKVVLESFSFVDSRGDQIAGTPPAPAASQISSSTPPSEEPPPSIPEEEGLEEDDVPF